MLNKNKKKAAYCLSLKGISVINLYVNDIFPLSFSHFLSELRLIFALRVTNKKQLQIINEM